MNDNDYHVYIIKGIKNDKIKYYIGCTNNLKRRLKQHNRELKGGAKSTHSYYWQYYCILSNIKDNITALQIEWRLKNASRKKNIISKIEEFLEYIEKYNKSTPNSQEIDYKILFLLNEEIYHKINKKEWSNIIMIDVNDNDFSSFLL
jgi:predicted GIY-YIG superfamily endonuclease